MKPALLKELEDEGFVRTRELGVRVPHRVFRLALELEEDRALTASETALLACVEGGSTSPDAIARALGLPDTRLVERIVIALLKRNALATGPTGFELTDAGRRLATRRQLRQIRHVRREARYVPATGRFRWFVPDELPRSGPPDLALEIPAARDLRGDALDRHLLLVQQLLEEDEYPSEDTERSGARTSDLVSARVEDEWIATTLATIEVWEHESGRVRLRVLSDGVEDGEASALYADWSWDDRSGRFRERARR